MMYFADADGSGTGNKARKLVRFHCANDPDIPTFYAAKCEIWGANPRGTERTTSEAAQEACQSRITDALARQASLESRRSNIPAVVLFSLKTLLIRLAHCYKCCHRCNQRRQSAVVFQRKGIPT
jgi:hypothetical protein